MIGDLATLRAAVESDRSADVLAVVAVVAGPHNENPDTPTHGDLADWFAEAPPEAVEADNELLAALAWNRSGRRWFRPFPWPCGTASATETPEAASPCRKGCGSRP